LSASVPTSQKPSGALRNERVKLTAGEPPAPVTKIRLSLVLFIYLARATFLIVFELFGLEAMLVSGFR
jgi:hypothetical protein